MLSAAFRPAKRDESKRRTYVFLAIFQFCVQGTNHPSLQIHVKQQPQGGCHRIAQVLRREPSLRERSASSG